ncbi:MAG: hypothetical protein AAB492_04155 [Patescibacteria group bacterium]
MNVNTHIFLLSQYTEMDSAYWGLGSSSDGSIYFALCTHQPNKSAMVFAHNPTTGITQKLFSLADYISNADTFLPQGKVHTPIFEGSDGLLYFGTHFAYPHGKPQPVTYEGGHLVSYDHKNNSIHDLGIALAKDGILSLTMDKERMLLYMLTAPSFHFIAYDIGHKIYKDYGQITQKGSICRSLTMDNNGNVYGSYEDNKIFRFDLSTATLEYPSVLLRAHGEKIREWEGASRGGVNKIGRNIWRSALWNESTKLIYGIHGGTSKLFEFDPKSETIKELDFMGADINKNHPEMIYPTLSLAQYKNMLFYTPDSGFFDYARSEKMKEHAHLVSYDILKFEQIDRGEIIDASGRRVYGVAGSVMDLHGRYYLLGAVEVLKNEAYNRQNILQKKPFHLGLIEIDINEYV